MKQQEVFKKIGGIIQEINEQYQYLQGSEANLNDLELELFVANTHFLKDHAEILRKLNAIKSQPLNKRISDEPKWFEPVVQPAKPTPPPAPTLFKLEPVATKEEEPFKFELGEPEEPAPVFEFGANKPSAPVEESAPSIDLASDAPADSYSFEREEEEPVRHELILGEADYAEDEEEGTAADEALLTPVAEIETEEPEAEEEQEAPVETEAIATPEPEAEPEPEVIEPEAEEPQPEPEPEPVEEPEPIFEPAPEPVEEPKAHVKPVAESMEDIQIESLKADSKNKKAEPEPGPVAETLPEPKTEPVLTLNQRLSAQAKDKKTATATSAAAPAEAIEPLADIKTAINLNDKLLFVKDLFRGYNLAYTEAIEIVNRFSNFEEADRFLRNNYVTKNDWESKKETAEKFYNLLKRRYA